jgi:uncharacterized protein (TIGR00725 family)
VVALHVGVVGSGEPTEADQQIAEDVGRQVAEAGAVLVCGGLGGVMEAACRGAAGAGGLTIGLLPGRDRTAANPWVQAVVATGLGEMRNCLVVESSDVVIAVGGEYGTLSEVAFALKVGKPVVGVGTWNLIRPNGELDGAIVASDPPDAVRTAIGLVGNGAPGSVEPDGTDPTG